MSVGTNACSAGLRTPAWAPRERARKTPVRKTAAVEQSLRIGHQTRTLGPRSGVAPGTYRVSGSFHRGPDGSNNQGAERVLPNDSRFTCKPRARRDSVDTGDYGPAARQLQALVRRLWGTDRGHG